MNVQQLATVEEQWLSRQRNLTGDKDYLVERSYLDRFEDLDALKQASREHPFLYRQRSLDVSFDHRGQMGDYWKAEQAHLRRWS